MKLFSLPSCLLFVLVSFGLSRACHAGSADDSSAAATWVGSWSTAPQLVEPGNNPPAPGLANNTLRQVVRTSLGGDSLRVRFSNEFSKSPVTLHEVHLAVSNGGSAIDSTTDRVLTFAGNSEVIVPPGTVVVSDPVQFSLQPRMDLAITISYGGSPSDITGHPGSRTTSYLLAGNAASRTNFPGAVTTDHWYNINGIDVFAPTQAASVAILGNSITDGRGSTTNAQNRWPDILSGSLLRDSTTRHVGVLNMGIGGNCVLAGGLGPTGVSRFDRDILGQPGVRWAIVFEGVNDIGGVRSATAATQTAANLIAAYGQMITKAHRKNIRIFGATITAFNGNGYFNQYSEQCRGIVNQWIRTRGNFDGCIDLDRVTRDPQDTTRLRIGTFQNDGLHPDSAGHRTIGESIDHHFFTGSDTVFQEALGILRPRKAPDGYALAQNYPNPFNPSTTISFHVPARSFISLDIFDLLGKQVGTIVRGVHGPGGYAVRFDGTGLSSGVYICRFVAGSFMQVKTMLLVR